MKSVFMTERGLTISPSSDYESMSLGLDRISKLLVFLGNPHHTFRSIHIAGTNGKGTTARWLHHILTQNKMRVGLFTSPHLLTVRERFQIGDDLISQGDFEAYYRRICSAWDTISDHSEILSLFEQYTALAFLYFADKKVDAAVIEVGLGGRLDATNVVSPEVSIITSIAGDHKDILGKSLGRIAREKGGIIKPGIPVVAGWSIYRRVRDVITRIAKQNQSPLTWVSSTDHRGMAMVALDQARWVVDESLVNRADFRNPGRWQMIPHDPPVLVDGAHNPAAIRYLCDRLQTEFPDRRIVFIV